MRKLLIAALLIGTFAAKAQDIAGSWAGPINVAAGINLHLVFNITHTGDTYSATFDSPDQKVFNIPCGKTTLTKDSVFIDIPRIRGNYKGAWNGKDSISGSFSQGSRTMQLNVGRITTTQKAALNEGKVRPQTPKPPYGYYSEDVEYDNADKTLHYGATFTRPDGEGKYPAVIIITGSGPQDRDGTMMNGHKPYWVLADYLTKNGIAVLRVDDRGVGKSTLGPNPAALTTVDFSHDVENSLNYLESRPDVDKAHIGLVGHSEGGAIAPMVAARRSDVSFIVLWAGPGVTGAQIIAKQGVEAMQMQGLNAGTLVAFNDLNEHMLNMIATAPNVAVLDTSIATYYRQWKARQRQGTLDSLHYNSDAALQQELIPQENGLYKNAWMRFFLGYDPATALSKVKCPVLALNGAKDKQVDPQQNLAAIKEILTQSGNKDFKVVEIPNLNHLFQDANTGSWTEYESIDETVSPVAMKIISDWIKLHTK
jgi:uncharacterized protein